MKCSICSQLSAHHRGCQNAAHPEQDTFLPEIAAKLTTAREIKSRGEREELIRRCPECGTYYHFKTDYEYLATGSEEEQVLTRLSGADAARYLR